ncbi:MAG: 3-hydroxyacyl-ACP dehydratase FabZ family protein [Legionellaceae bacterium]
MRFLFVDRIVELVPGEVIRGIKCITRDDYYLRDDEQGRAYFLPCIMGEALGQLAAWNVMFTQAFVKRPVAGIAARALLHRKAYVGETLLLEATIDALDDAAVQYHGHVRVGDELVFSLEGALGPLLPMGDFIDEALVRRQFEEINRPGEWSRVSSSVVEVMDPIVAQGVGSRVASMMFDAIIKDEPGVRLTAVKFITRAAPYFADHFPNKPVLPMTVLLECSLNLAHEFVRRASYEQLFEVRSIRRTKMSDFIVPGDAVIASLHVKKQDHETLILACRVDVMDKRVCVFEIEMVVIT